MLFWKELKKIIFGVPYFLFVVMLVFVLRSQDVLDFSNSKITKPEPNGNYGTKNEEIPEIIMPAALQSLYAEFQENNYKTYPIGFIKNVKLNDNEQIEIAKMISTITGVDVDKIYTNSSHNNEDMTLDIKGNADIQPDGKGGFIISTQNNSEEKNEQDQQINLTVRDDISYSEFKNLMQKVDDILGGGSAYAPESLISYGVVSLTYEEAVQRYELIKSHDKMTGGYARLFSDYTVAMALSILPVFLAVTMSIKDKRSKISELIYTKKISGIKIIFVRFFATITAVMLPVIILSYLSNITVWSMYKEMKLDYLMPLKYDFGWIMPSAMIVIAIGMCLTELTNTPIAVAVNGLWWFLDINMGMKSVTASYSLFRLVPRHNADIHSYFRIQDFIDNFSNLLVNRLLFVGLSILLVIVTILIYEAKRKGKLNGNNKIREVFTSITNRKSQS